MKSIKKINTTKFEIIEAQELWAQNVIEIGDLYTKNKDYKSKANIFVKEFYAFDVGEVLFKPTRCQTEQFRKTKPKALSYFISGKNRACLEDKGFALKPWTNVRFENAGLILEKSRAFSMGNYFFTDTKGNEIKVEFTFGYILIGEKLKIDLHHSSFPYSNSNNY